MAFMTWRYVEMPLQSYEILFLRKAGHVQGYVVLGTYIDPDKRTGQVTDILAVDDDERSLALLLAAASDRLARLGAEVAAFGFCENVALRAAARRAGFLRSKPSRPRTGQSCGSGDVRPAEGGYRPPLPDTGRSGRRLLGGDPSAPRCGSDPEPTTSRGAAAASGIASGPSRGRARAGG